MRHFFITDYNCYKIKKFRWEHINVYISTQAPDENINILTIQERSKLVLIIFESTEKYYSPWFLGNQMMLMLTLIIFINYLFSL